MHYWASKEFRRENPERVRRQLVKRSPFAAHKLAASIIFVLSALCAWLLWDVHALKDVPRSDVYVHELLADGEMRGAEKPAPFVPPAVAGLLLLLLHTPEPMESHARYGAVLRDNAGETIWEGYDLVPGKFDTFAVSIPRRFLPAGRYRISLEAIESSGRKEVLVDYDLQIAESDADARSVP
jgi:hypothetical protein